MAAANHGWLVCFHLLAIVSALATAPLPAGAQPAAAKVPRVGVLGVISAAGYARQVEAMRQGFRDLGYVESCAVGSWGGQRPGLGDYVTVTGPRGGAIAAGGC
jgi:hypothetical protein